MKSLLLNADVKKILVQHTNLLSGSLVIIACIFLALFFPATNFLQTITREIVFFVIIPCLYIKLILKKTLASFGLNIKNKKAGFLWIFATLSFSLFFFYLLVSHTNFSKEYRVPEEIMGDFKWFVFYEFIIMNSILFMQEIFFRGFVLSIFSRYIGAWSIAVQGILNIVLITAGQKLSWSEIPFSFLAISSGIIAYKSRSFIYSYLSALLFQLILDSYIIYSIKSLT